jgi:hypothetical protein
MAENITSLGIAVDTSQVKQADSALDRLAGTTGKAAQGVGRFESGIQQFNSTAARMAQAVEQNTRTQQAYANATSNVSRMLQEVNNKASDFVTQQQSLARAVNDNTAALGRLASAASDAASRQQQHSAATRDSAAASSSAASAAQSLRGVVAGLAAAYASFKIGEHIKEVTLLNARYETLGVVMDVVGRNVGLLPSQMEATAKALQDTGISMLESRQQATRLIQAHIDLSNATKLARIAQDAAVIGNMNSSEAFATLIHGIQTYQTDVLRTIGINVNMDQAFKIMADTLHKHQDQLTQNERVQAVLNAVMKAGADIAGTYEAAMGTAGKQMKSLERFTEDLKVKQGEVFSQAFSALIVAYTAHVKEANDQMNQMASSDAINRWGNNIASVLKAVINGINNVIVGFKALNNWQEKNRQINDVHADAERQRDKISTNVLGFRIYNSGSSAQKQEIDAEEARRTEAVKANYEKMYKDLQDQVNIYNKAWEHNEQIRTNETKKQNNSRLALDQEFLTKRAALERKYGNDSVKLAQETEKLRQQIYEPKAQFKDTPAINKPDKAGIAAAKKLENEQYREALAEQEQLFKFEQSIAKTQLDAVDHLEKMGVVSSAQALEQKLAIREKEITNEQSYVQKQLELATRKKDLDARAKYNGELKTLEEERSRIEMDTYNKIAELREAEIQKSNQAMESYIDSIRKITEAANNEASGKTADALQAEEAARTAIAVAATEQLLAETKLSEYISETEIVAYQEQLAWLKQIQKAHEDAAQALSEKRIADDAKRSAEQATQSWKQSFDRIEGWLSDAIMRGFEHGKGFIKTLIDAIKAAFARLILQPIIAPIAAIGANIFSGGAYGGEAGSGMGGLQQAYQYYQGLSAAGGVGGYLGQGVSALGGYMGNGTLQNIGYGMQGYTGGTYGASGVSFGNALGTGVNYAAGAYGGIALGSAISGDYGSRSTVNIGTAIGAAAAGPIGAVIGGALGGLANRAFGMGNKETTAQGLMVDFNSDSTSHFANFQDWKQKGGWFRSDKSGENTFAIPQEQANALSEQMFKMKDSVNSLAKTIGVGTSQITSFYTNFKVQFQHTGNAEADAAANAAAVQKAFGQVSDSLALMVIPTLKDYQLQGETNTQTLVRLSAEFQATDSVLLVLGKTSQQAFGTVGLASMAARDQLVQFAGGIDALTNQVSFYVQNFYNDQEKLDLLQRQLAPVMQQLGVSSIHTKDEFKQVVNSIDLSTEAGRKMYVQMMQLAPAFNELSNAQEQEAEKQRQMAEQRRQQLEQEIQALSQAAEAHRQYIEQLRQTANDSLMPDDMKLYMLQNEVNAMFDSWGLHISSQQDLLNAIAKSKYGQSELEYQQLLEIAPKYKEMLDLQDKLAQSQEKTTGSDAVDRLQSTFDDIYQLLDDGRKRFDDFAQSLNKFKQSLLTSDMSPLTPKQQYDVARAKFTDISARASAGDESAIAQLQDVSSEFLRLSRQMFASSEQYTTDFNKVQDALSASVVTATQQSALLSAQLKTMETQVNGLIELKNTTATGFNTLGNTMYDRLEAIRKASEAIEKAVREVNGQTGSTSGGTGTAPSQIPTTSTNPIPTVYAPASNGYWNPTQAKTIEDFFASMTGGSLISKASASLAQYQLSTGMSIASVENYMMQHDSNVMAAVLSKAPSGYSTSWGSLAEHFHQLSQYYPSYTEMQKITSTMSSAGVMSGFNSAVTNDPSKYYWNPQGALTALGSNLNLDSTMKASYLYGSHATGLDYVPFDGYIAKLHQGERVLSAVKARAMDMEEASIDLSRFRRPDNNALLSVIESLKAEVRKLREEQAQQTESMIRSNFDANDRAASTVVEGTKDAAKSSTWRERNKPELN